MISGAFPPLLHFVKCLIWTLKYNTAKQKSSSQIEHYVMGVLDQKLMQVDNSPHKVMNNQFQLFGCW